MTPRHMLTMNPYTPADAILALLKAKIKTMLQMWEVKEVRSHFVMLFYYNHHAYVFVRMYFYLFKHGIAIENKFQSSFLVNPNDDMNTGSSSKSIHDLAGNPFVPADTIAALLEFKMEARFCSGKEGLTPLDYAKEYNVNGLIDDSNCLQS